jgi:hypothetical protein
MIPPDVFGMDGSLGPGSDYGLSPGGVTAILCYVAPPLLFTRQCFPGNTFLFKASYSTPHIDSLSDPVSAADWIREENL